jgi:hypothetical protein
MADRGPLAIQAPRARPRAILGYLLEPLHFFDARRVVAADARVAADEVPAVLALQAALRVPLPACHVARASLLISLGICSRVLATDR